MAYVIPLLVSVFATVVFLARAIVQTVVFTVLVKRGEGVDGKVALLLSLFWGSAATFGLYALFCLRSCW